MAYIRSGGGGASAPVLIGSYSGNQNIDVSNYKRESDTVDNFWVVVTSVSAISATKYFNPSSNFTMTRSAIVPAKSLTGNTLVTTGMYGTISTRAESGQTSTVSETLSYNVYHV